MAYGGAAGFMGAINAVTEAVSSVAIGPATPVKKEDISSAPEAHAAEVPRSAAASADKVVRLSRVDIHQFRSVGSVGRGDSQELNRSVSRVPENQPVQFEPEFTTDDHMAPVSNRILAEKVEMMMGELESLSVMVHRIDLRVAAMSLVT